MPTERSADPVLAHPPVDHFQHPHPDYAHPERPAPERPEPERPQPERPQPERPADWPPPSANPLVGYIPGVVVPAEPVQCTGHFRVERVAADLVAQLESARNAGYRLVTVLPLADGTTLVFAHADHD